METYLNLKNVFVRSAWEQMLKMTEVQIDDFECEVCKEVTIANFDISTGEYTCLKCGGHF